LIPHWPPPPPLPPPPHYWSDDHSFLSPSDSLSSLSLSLKVKKLLECVCVCVCFQTPEHECFVSGRWLASDSYHQEETEGRWESWSLHRCSSSLNLNPLQSSLFLSVPSTKPSTPAQLSPALKPPLCLLLWISFQQWTPFFPLN
jgi:hypothetical protein